MVKYFPFLVQSCVLILLTLCACDGDGAYIVEVTLHSYSNPTGRCDECQEGPEPGCCDETFVRPAGDLCPSTSACDTAIQHCVEATEGTMCDSFTFYSGDSNSLNLERSVHGLDNPVILRGNEAWDGVRFALIPHDCTEVDDRCGPSNQIDIVFIDIDIPPGTSSPARIYTGSAGIVTFSVSFSVRCADGFSGVACDQCNGLQCINGMCVRGDNSFTFTCVCNPGFTGDRCQNAIGGSQDSNEVHIGAIVGGAIAGVFILLCMWVTVLCVCLMVRKSRRTNRAENIAAPPPYSVATATETKVTNYELKMKNQDN